MQATIILLLFYSCFAAVFLLFVDERDVVCEILLFKSMTSEMIRNFGWDAIRFSIAAKMG